MNIIRKNNRTIITDNRGYTTVYPDWCHIPESTSVDTGYGNGEVAAPARPGYYTLWEITKDNQHIGWKFEKEA